MNYFQELERERVWQEAFCAALTSHTTRGQDGPWVRGFAEKCANEAAEHYDNATRRTRLRAVS